MCNFIVMKYKSKIAILFAILFIACSKNNDPKLAAPIITFVEASMISLSDTTCVTRVKFEFIDEDGDLGLKQDEGTGEFQTNVFVDYYKKVDGVWILGSQDLDSRFPFLENEEETSLQGEIEIDLLCGQNIDTFRYDIFIKDRALHSSNIISTTELTTK